MLINLKRYNYLYNDYFVYSNNKFTKVLWNKIIKLKINVKELYIRMMCKLNGIELVGVKYGWE